MASKSAQRAQKKRERDRKKRAGKKHVRRQASSGGFKQAAGWPLGDCWATDTYAERGAELILAFSREHESGRVAVVFLDIDLAEEGVRSVSTFGNVTANQVMGELAKRGEGQTIIEVDPALVVKIAHAARDLMGDEPAPKGFDDALLLFGDVLPEDCDEEILTGLEDTEEIEVDHGMFAGVKRFFGLI